MQSSNLSAETRQQLYRTKDSLEGKVLLQYLTYRLGEAKDQMVSASPENLQRIQHRAQTFAEIIRHLTEPPVNTQNPTY